MNSRVGERATSCGVTHSPLVEPDKRISRHPALLKTHCLRHAQAVARLPASTGSPAQNAGLVYGPSLQVDPVHQSPPTPGNGGPLPTPLVASFASGRAWLIFFALLMASSFAADKRIG